MRIHATGLTFLLVLVLFLVPQVNAGTTDYSWYYIGPNGSEVAGTYLGGVKPCEASGEVCVPVSDVEITVAVQDDVYPGNPFAVCVDANGDGVCNQADPIKTGCRDVKFSYTGPPADVYVFILPPLPGWPGCMMGQMGSVFVWIKD